MKKLLLVFSVFALALGSSFELASCGSQVKQIVDADDEDANPNQDIDTLNQIKAKVKETLTKWWQQKTTIDINDFPEQEASFKELVTKVNSEAEVKLTGEEIKDFRFLNQLISGFKAEFDNLNQELQNQYSNYYSNSMPLFLGNNNIQFILKKINFDKIARLLDDTPQALFGVTLQIRIPYEVRFKQLVGQEEIINNVIISNNLDAINNIQINLSNYFINFINKIFDKKNYQIIAITNYNTIDFLNTILPVITKELVNHNILFNGDIDGRYDFFNHTFLPYYSMRRFDSVLAWAGEGYDPTKLTVENFLKFYKSKYLIREGDYYIRGKIPFLLLEHFTIENLPLKTKEIKLKTPVKIMILKDKVDQDLAEFAKVIMVFWHYYKLETYRHNYKLVFNMKQTDFDMLVKANDALFLKKQYDMSIIFKYIINLPINTLDLNKKILIRSSIINKQSNNNNLFRTSKGMTIQLFYGKSTSNVMTLGYNDFAYSFLINPTVLERNIGNDKNLFLQIIEFKVI